MAEDSSFIDLMDRLRKGDPQAAARIFDLYAKRLIGLASKKLSPRIAQKESPEDVAQSALKSFFLRQQRQPFDLSNWNNLWSLLARITLNKIGRRVEHWSTQKADASKEKPLGGGPDDSTASWIAIARDPSADEALSPS
ncbi:MAG: hypothetical protein K2W96_07725, partial [Gemmataceae bacterium]|nr:hypothetical protein [Gemmataceae bacterium]